MTRIKTCFLAACFLSMFVCVPLLGSIGPVHPNAVSSADFANSNSLINSAFAATNNAEQKGGNVTTLVAKLDLSLTLYQKAQVENVSNPSQAAMDLQNATLIANQVLSEAPEVASAGSSARETMYITSIGSAIVIVAIATLVYIYGSRIYHLTWFYLYRKHLITKGEE